MVETTDQTLLTRTSAVISNFLETLITTVRNNMNVNPPALAANENVSAAPVSQPVRDFREVQLPETKIGLGSNEGELIVLVKKYLEIVGLVFFVWLLGYFQFSVSWILLAVFVYLFRQRQRTQFKERHRMLNEINNNEERYIKARLDELPSWVFFPDVERAEWVNRIIKQAWPFANKYMDQAVFRDVMIPMIRSAAPGLSDFDFQRLDLGEMPPRIGGVKVYTDNVRDQIMMDMEVFYAGDAHIKAKLKGIVCGIKDIQFVGEVRIILSPLINTIPLFGAVTYFFLRKPSIDFKLTDAGSLMDIPGLNDLMLTQISDIVGSMMVLPNRQVFPMVAGLKVAQMRCPNPQGVVRVFVVQARDLIKADINFLGKGKSDPFVKVKANGKEFKTKTIDNNTNPEWNEVFEFVIEQYETATIEFEVFDEDPGKDDFIGKAQFPVKALVGKDTVDTWLTLQDVKTGSLNVRLQYFSLSTKKSALDVMERTNNQMIKREQLSAALLMCFIDRCTGLPRSKKTRREPNSFCRIKVDKNEDKTLPRESQTNPQFEHVTQFLCSNPLQQKLVIEICDSRSNNEVIAFFELLIKQIYDTDTMIIDTQTFPLRSHSEPLDGAKISLRLSLLILSPGLNNERRANPSTTRAPTLMDSQSFDGVSLSSTNVTTDLKPTVRKEAPTRTSQENSYGASSIASAFKPLTPTTESHFPVDNRVTTDRANLVIANDPDLERSSRYGRIKIGVRYTTNRKALSVSVVGCNGLMKVHEQNLPDPYVRVYLMPDFKKDKKKTKPIHDSLNPEFKELFEWSASIMEARQQRLHFSVKNNSPLFAQEQTYMGDLEIDLSNLDGEKASVAWYALQEPHTSAGGMVKIKYDQACADEQNTQL